MPAHPNFDSADIVRHAFSGAYAGRRVFVTGHTGFKGSWLVAWLKLLGAEVSAFALSPVPGESHWDLVGPELELHGVRSTVGDIRDLGAIEQAIASAQPEIVFHLAAQSLVRPGYVSPLTTFDVNVRGTMHVLEAVRRVSSVGAVVSVTSDKCYAPAGEVPLEEDAPLGGLDPYSASKSCAEIVSACWRASYLAPRGNEKRVALATVRAGNVIGGGDWAVDRIIPDVVRAARSGAPVRLRRPEAVRPWQHVLEPLSGYLLLGERLLQSNGEDYAEAWNFGPDAAGHTTVGTLVEKYAQRDPRVRLELDESPSVAETRTLRLSNAKAAARLGWRPVWDVGETIARTATWYVDHESGEAMHTIGDIAAYVAAARAAGLAWAGDV